ncbi:MAG: TonB-dependent receptor [Candidatus Kryptonium sp.]
MNKGYYLKDRNSRVSKIWNMVLKSGVFVKLANVVLTITATPLFAKVTHIPEIEIVGERILRDKAEVSIQAETLPASVQVITSENLERTNIRHYTDIYRKIPGMKVIYMGQGEVGDRLGTRGFWNGFAVFVDGVPLNMPHHMHLHGLADAAWILPEMIEKIEIIKGPFSALYGNFALGGAINIITKKEPKISTLRSELGSYGTMQGVVAYGNKNVKPMPFLVYEVFKRDGYRDNSYLTRYNAFNKITFPVGDKKLSLRLNYVKREWGAPGYLSKDDLKRGLVKREEAVDRTDDGHSEYLHFVLNLAPREEKGLHVTIYGAYEDFVRVATFRPSPQRIEHNRRNFYGWNLLYNYMPSKSLSFILGTDGRFDDGTAKRHNSIRRKITATTHSWDVEELNLGLFTQLQWKLIEKLKLIGGLRYDYFHFDVKNRIRLGNSGDGDTDILSPKVGIVFSPLKNIHFYTNYGTGFRSPYMQEMSPHDRDYKNYNLDPAKLMSWDIGIKGILFERVDLNINFYKTKMEREITRIGPDVVNLGESERDGYEGEVTFYVTDKLSIWFNYAKVKARIVNPPANRGKVTNVPKEYINAGIEWTMPLGSKANLSFDFYTQIYGKTPLNSSGTVNRGSFAKYYGKLNLNYDRFTLYGGVIFHPEKYKSEGHFLVNNIEVIDPRPKWDVNLGLKYKF